LGSSELVEERVRLWRVLWGDADSGGGYLDELDADVQGLALELFDRFRTSTVSTKFRHRPSTPWFVVGARTPARRRISDRGESGL
jgi:hypothetical protein